MEFREALATRRSIRAFRPDPVAPELIERIIGDATDAPSWGNTQPYRLAIASGSSLGAIGAELEQRFWKLRGVRKLPKPLRPLAVLFSGARPDGDFNTLIDYPPELAARYRKTGFGLYAALGIRRDDYAARDAQMAKNFRGFGAPVRRRFAVPKAYKLLCGVALGYPADAAENAYRPERLPVSELLIKPR